MLAFVSCGDVFLEWAFATINGLIGMAVGIQVARRNWEADAVKHGAATWTVDENGNRVFRWKKQEQGEK